MIMLKKAIQLSFLLLFTHYSSAQENVKSVETNNLFDKIQQRSNSLNQSVEELGYDLKIETVDAIAEKKGLTMTSSDLINKLQNTQNPIGGLGDNNNQNTPSLTPYFPQLSGSPSFGTNVPLRDPFNLSDSLITQIPSDSIRPTTFLPSSNQQELPKLKLKGVLSPKSGADDELMALLEVNKDEVYMVKVGDEISYDPTRPSAAIKIKSISRLSVTVNVGTLGNVLIVR